MVGSARIAWTVWSTGVMPEPPAMKPILRNGVLAPEGVYVKVVMASAALVMPLGRLVLKMYSPRGPLTSTVSP